MFPWPCRPRPWLWPCHPSPGPCHASPWPRPCHRSPWPCSAWPSTLWPCCHRWYTTTVSNIFSREYSTMQLYTNAIQLRNNEKWLNYNRYLPKTKKLKPNIALNGKPMTELRASLAIWDHTVLPVTRHKWTRTALTLANQAGTRFTYPGRMEGWVDLGRPIVARPGIEPTTAWSQVQRPNHYAT